MKKPENFTHHLFESGTSSFRQIINHVYELQAINQLLHTLIEPTLAEHCQVANMRDNSLILQTDSSVWAMKLRYQFPDILQKLRESGLRRLNKIECYIQPNEN